MKIKNKKLEKILRENTVPAREVFKDFTEKDRKIIEDYKRYYYILTSLIKLRKKMKLTQAHLAKKADLPRTTITKIESGNYNPTLNTLMTIATAMNKKLEVRFV